LLKNFLFHHGSGQKSSRPIFFPITMHHYQIFSQYLLLEAIDKN